MAGKEEENEQTEQVSLRSGEVTEDDLTIKASDIRKMVVQPSDWTIGVLVDLLRRGKIDLQPNYQRRVAWDEKKMSLFIETLFLNLPVPQIVMAEIKPGRFAVIDGKQRINSLARFCLDDENPLRLQKLYYRKELSGKTYEEIEQAPNLEDALDAFQSHTVRTIVIKNWVSDSLLYLLFLRLNQNSVSLSPQELRRALYPGEFMNWLDDKTATSSGMAAIFATIPDFRMRDMEVATRHLAFTRRLESYAGNMKQFLDSATEAFRDNFANDRTQLEQAWLDYEAAIATTVSVFGKNAFQARVRGVYQSSKNRAVMDVMTYFFAIPAVRQAANGHEAEIKQAYEHLCNTSREFLESIQTSTKTTKATRQRFNDWGDALRATLGNSVPNFPLARIDAE